MLFEHIFPNRFFINKLFLFLTKVWFSKQEFFASTSISNFQYNYLESPNYNTFHLFYNQLNYILAHYFAKPKITKGNIDKFLSYQFITPFIKKLVYQNIMKHFEKQIH